jgi:hypothetical protein
MILGRLLKESPVHFWLLCASAAIWIAFIVYWSAAAGAQAYMAPANSDASTQAAKTGRRPWISVQIKWQKSTSPKPDSKSRESAGSRQIHQLLLWCAILFALLPGFPPLNRSWLPALALISDSSGLRAFLSLGDAPPWSVLEWGHRNKAGPPDRANRPVSMAAASNVHRDHWDVRRHSHRLR